MAASPESEGSTSEPPTRCVTSDAGRYLLELYWLSLDRDGRISTGEIGDRLGVSPASVTGMVSKLADLGLVDHRKYQGLELTERGDAVSEVLAWRYCLVTNLFREVLDAPIDPETAYRFGFRLPREGVATLGEKLGVPCMRACSGSAQVRERCRIETLAEA